MVKITIGDYPPEYKPEVHGPYDPARYYGKPDTPFGQVKLCDLKSWFGRRNYNPRAIVQAVSRGYWRWQHKYTLVKYPNAVYIIQVVTVAQIIFYAINIGKKLCHRKAKYH
ncbi:hypothetical protein PGB90_006796 [Kerria lacca]